MKLDKLYEEYVSKVVRPIKALERRTKSEVKTSEWNLRSFGFFYELGKKQGCLPETNSKIVRKKDSKRYQRDMRTYGEAPKEYLVDLCWRKWSKTTWRYWLELALEQEWQPTARGGYEDEDMDEDIYKLLDVNANIRIAILGIAPVGGKYLGNSNLEDMITTFCSYVKAKDVGNAKFLLILVDNSDKKDSYGVKGVLVSHDGVRRDLLMHLYRDMK